MLPAFVFAHFSCKAEFDARSSVEAGGTFSQQGGVIRSEAVFQA